jgi:hypothetical protein
MSGDASSPSVYKLLSSHLLSKGLNIKIHRTIIMHVLCMGVKLSLPH